VSFNLVIIKVAYWTHMRAGYCPLGALLNLSELTKRDQYFDVYLNFDAHEQAERADLEPKNYIRLLYHIRNLYLRYHTINWNRELSMWFQS